MALEMVGKVPATGRGMQTAEQTQAQLDTAKNARNAVVTRCSQLAAAYANKKYVDDRDALYAAWDYYSEQDKLYLPLTAKGVPNGVATLGADGKVPATQLPALGVGFIRGPWGHVNVTNAGVIATGGTKLKIADWGTRPGVVQYSTQVLAWMSVTIQSARAGRPVVEIRAGGSADTTYASQVLVARGYGRRYYDDSQTITVQPCADLTGRVPDWLTSDGDATWSLGPNFDLRLTAWLYDEVSTGQSTLLQANHIVASSAWLARVAL